MVKPEYVAEGVAMFAEAELLPALGGWQLGVCTAALYLARKRAAAVLDALKGNSIVSALGVMDDDGLVDVEAAADALKYAARKQGKISVDIPVIDISYSFTEQNIEALRGYIQKAAGAE